MTALSLSLFADGLAVGNLRSLKEDLYAELRLKLACNGVKMLLAETCEDKLARSLVILKGNGRIFLGKTHKTCGKLFFLALILRTNGHFIVGELVSDLGKADGTCG